MRTAGHWRTAPFVGIRSRASYAPAATRVGPVSHHQDGTQAQDCPREETSLGACELLRAHCSLGGGGHNPLPTSRHVSAHDSDSGVERRFPGRWPQGYTLLGANIQGSEHSQPSTRSVTAALYRYERQMTSTGCGTTGETGLLCWAGKGLRIRRATDGDVPEVRYLRPGIR